MNNWLEINAAAIRANLHQFQKLVGKQRTAVVLKSNAYGHGLKQVYEILKGENLKWIATNYLTEAKKLRELEFEGHILIVGPIFSSELADALKLNCEVFVSSHEVLRTWVGMPSRPKAHIKFDTGLSRQGFSHEQHLEIIKTLKPAWRDVAGVCTHFANVEDVLEQEYAQLQLSRFALIKQAFEKEGFSGIFHSAASASALILPESHFDLCRIGISLFGQWPSNATKLSYANGHRKVIDLEPAISWKSKVQLVKSVKRGEFIGYGCTFRAAKDMTIALVPVGYFEGYPRICSNSQSYVLIGENRCQITGRISMNMMVADVSHLPNVACEDEVVLIGRQGSEYISATDVAGWAQTIHYELLTRLNADIPRLVINQ
jgi:alanine racemase